MSKIYGIYDQVEMAPYPLTILQEFQVTRTTNSHDSAVIKGIISQEMLTMYEYMMGSGSCVTLSFWQKGKKHLLFSGFLDQMKVLEEGNQRRVSFQLSGLTKALDRKGKWMDYQSEHKKKSELIKNIMVSYNNVQYTDCCKDKVIPEFLLQYEETDYEFLGRLLGDDGEKIYTVMNKTQGSIHYGKPETAKETELDMTDYQAFFHRHLQYQVKSDQFLDLGSRVKTPLGVLLVEKAEYSLKKGKSENSYVLCRPKDFSCPVIHNQKMTGISLDATIKDRKRDKVKIELDRTPEAGEQNRRWFSYSSVASSGDGSGWYCMPEVGEEVRLFLPTDKEKDAYVISAIRSDSGGYASNAGGAREPENKSLSNVQGQEVNFTSEGVTLNCAGDVTSMKLTKEGEITITAINDIEITSGEQVCIRAEQGVVINGKEGITIHSQAGGDIQMAQNIDINAKRIKNNC